MSFFIGGDYIKRYEKEILQAQLDNEKAVLKQLERNYADALEEVNSKIAELMGRADADMQHVIYQADYQRALKAQIQGILKALQSNEFSTVSEYLTKCYDEGFLGTMYSLQEQGVPLVIPMNQEEIAAAIQHETNLSSGLYASFDTADLQKKIASEISRGFTVGSSFSEIARNVASYAGVSRNNANRIVRTEGHRIVETAAHHAQQKAKARGADVVKIWDAALDAKTRDSHVKVDGEIRDVDEKFSNGLMFPGDPSGKAAEVINCRCRARTEATWALDANQTKMLGDTSKMSPEQRETIAKKLGIPEDALDQYSGQIVPIKAKNYKDFKNQYNKLWQYEGSDLQKEAESRIAGYENAKNVKKSALSTKEGLENAVSHGKIEPGKAQFANGEKPYEIKLPRGKKKEILARGASEARPIFAEDTATNKFASNVAKVKPEDGFYDVALHGGDTNVEFFGTPIDAYTLSQIIRQREDYNSGTAVRLLSCSTGNIDNTGDCVAQLVANELGVHVIAPTDTLYVDQEGRITIGKRNTGTMKEFYPRK